MPRTLSPINSISGSLSDGDDVTGNFADIDKPAAGDWTLKVNLAKSDDCPVSALIEVYQDRSPIAGELILASTTVSPTTTPTDYELPVTPAQLATGRCHLSQVKVRVTASTEECSEVETECCPEVEIPVTLQVKLHCDMLSTAEFEITWSDVTSRWEWSDASRFIRLRCDQSAVPPDWKFDITGVFDECRFTSEESIVTTVQCQPFQLNHVHPSGDLDCECQPLAVSVYE